MKIIFEKDGRSYLADLSKPLDISIPLIPGSEAPNCFWAPHFEAEGVKSGDWIGDTTQGGNLNFKNVRINPHGNGTHTECVGHIAKEPITINSVLKKFHCLAQVVSIYPQKMSNGDRVISLEQVQSIDFSGHTEALVLRTLPNGLDKMKRIYSGSNPPYIDYRAIQFLVDKGIQHFLLDLPSVDREEDGGNLSAHKAFWNYPNIIDTQKTITEMIFVDESIKDGLYLLNLQIASFELDASPSKPVLYRLNEN